MKESKNYAKRIVLTGGHAGTTAMAVIEELVSREGGWDIYWIGPKETISGKGLGTWEQKVFPNLGVNFRGIVAGKLQKKWTVHSVLWLAKIPVGFFQAFFLILKIKPKIILSFGGYAALPVVVVSWLFKIPVIIHEQTSVLGIGNKLSLPFAKKVALARVENLKNVKSGKAVVVGNPLMKSISLIEPKKELSLIPVIYITGGSRGSQFINRTLEPILIKLLAKYTVIHQTGGLDYIHFKTLKKSLPLNIRGNYQVYSFIDPMQVDNVYRQADIVVGRSGANTVSELMYIKRPAILIPHPALMYDEQAKNAEFARQYGIAYVIKQDGLTPEVLYEGIGSLLKNWGKVQDEVRNKVSPDLGAADRLADLIEEVVS